MKIAAVIYEPKGSEAVDRMLDVLAGDLKALGYRVAGAVQRNQPGIGAVCSNMALEELVSGRSFDISVCDGPNDGGCTLNPEALEDVAGLVAAHLDQGADLLILNRYGKQEAGGHGFRSVIAAAILGDVPVLVALNATYRGSWAEFTGHGAVELRPDIISVKTWCAQAVDSSRVAQGG